MTFNELLFLARVMEAISRLLSRYHKAWDFHPQVGLIISGGYSHQTGMMNQVERSVDYGVSFQELAPIPIRIYSHCLTIVDETIVFAAGGLVSTYSHLMYM